LVTILITIEELRRSMRYVTKEMTMRYLHPEDALLTEKSVRITGAVEKLFRGFLRVIIIDSPEKS
jgi:hypothetical protein